jgi:hypothetical protein
MRSLSNKALNAAALAAALLFLGLTISVRLGTGPDTVKQVKSEFQQEILIFYANETPPDAVSSVNYELLFDALRASGNPELARQVDVLKSDAARFPALVERQIGIIAAAAGEGRFTALIFTNALARRGKFLLLETGATARELEAFQALGVPSSGLLEASPLARPEALRAALGIAAALPQTRGRPAILITSSHGDDAMAVMPRVVADLSRVDRDAFVAALRTPGAASRASHAVPIGISKVRYWDVLSRVGGDIQFALVFREACRSGITSFAEYASLPSNVVRIAHTGRRDIKVDEVDYAKLFFGLSSERKLSQQLDERLRLQGIELSSPLETLVTLAWQAMASAAPATLFVPLVVWIVWATRRINARSHAAAMSSNE